MGYNAWMLATILFNMRRRITPRCGIEMTRKSLRTELLHEQDSISSDQARMILDGLEARSLEIMEKEASWQQDIPSMKKLEWASSILAAHELLTDLLGDEGRSIEILDRTMQRSWNTAWNRFLVRRISSKVRKNDGHVTKIMNGLLGHYGIGWRWKSRRSKETPGMVVVWTGYCFYMRYMASHGHPELTPLFRNLDKMWMGMNSNCRGSFRVESNATRAPEDEDHPIVFTFINEKAIRSA